MPDSNPGLMTIFTEALACTDAADRASYLDQACAGDAELRKRVDELLAAHPAMGRFLEPDKTSQHEPVGTAAYDPDVETGAHTPDASTGTFEHGPSVSVLSAARAFCSAVGCLRVLVAVAIIAFSDCDVGANDSPTVMLSVATLVNRATDIDDKYM